MTIDPATSIGTVELTVGDLDAQTAYYRDSIGLRELRRDGDRVELGAPESEDVLVTLVADPDAPLRPPGTTGLFHVAFLVPSRAELARSIRRVTASGHRFTGASDHLVSEALYLDDPEGNGIEIYRDRPVEEWKRSGGELEMATLPLDVEGVLATVPEGDVGDGMAPGTRVGHIHLQVASIPAAEAFYVGALGFETTVRRYPGALFVSAGGYHHHVGLNTWAGEGAAGATVRRARSALVHRRPAERGCVAGDVAIGHGAGDRGRRAGQACRGRRSIRQPGRPRRPLSRGRTAGETGLAPTGARRLVRPFHRRLSELTLLASSP